MPPFKLGLMAEQWMLFESVCLKGASDLQRRDMKVAFYAGAECILFRIIQSFAPESEPTETDLKIMENVYQELVDFSKAVQKGKI
jgi:hypothetical protein